MNKEKIIKRWKNRDVSWSQLSSWNYNKHQWANTYLLGNRYKPNAKMVFGNVVGDSLGTPNSLVPELEPHLCGAKEYPLHTTMNGLQLIGFADHYCPKTRVLNENKTSIDPERWSQKDADAHGQLTMYALMLLLEEKVKPEDLKMWLNFIPVVQERYGIIKIPDEPVFHRFSTKRTTKEVLLFGSQIKKTLKDMEEYASQVVIC